ncbi:MAG: hypothetical protein P8Q36_09055 [Alphaproteobacteria bacterium]|jgi:hypothetical protein|nr:hypothetical protein [Rhodospirillaceae bacterium]MDG2480997.1 hypothetical protein [Alphaproteobacteria bacterium]MBT6206002.1 hypothetical protein [Rhodospirillaceae bacterium]MBT6510959.1 hypothetical protein [Rhodospirillaceae bacterium]MBT7614323.1 hypothetical protein [Rhodospirillaceae bacterium]
MHELMVVARLFPEVQSGDKTSNMRWHENPIVPGPMTYRCEGEPERTVVVWVAGVTDVVLSQAAAFVGKADLWPVDVMLDGMREHYPAITLDDVVQIVEHLTPDQTRLRMAGSVPKQNL